MDALLVDGVPASEVSAIASGRVFFGALALVTALPLLVLGFGIGITQPANYAPSAAGGAFIGALVLATSFGHVLSTSFVYIDRGCNNLIRQNRQWFMLWPALAIAIAMISFVIGPLAFRIMYMAYYAWQLWHFQRQNYGVISFAAQIRKRGALPHTLNAMLNMGTAGGVLAILSQGPFLNWPALWWAALVPFAVSTALLVHLLYTSRRFTSDGPVMFFAVMGWAFFVPILLSPNFIVAFLSYGVAHGAQYLIFMSVMARGSAMKVLGPPVMVATTGLLVLVFYRMTLTPAGSAAYTGVVMAHFVVDAKLWRMREPLQRGLIRQRFAFVFGQAPAR